MYISYGTLFCMPKKLFVRNIFFFNRSNMPFILHIKYVITVLHGTKPYDSI